MVKQDIRPPYAGYLPSSIGKCHKNIEYESSWSTMDDIPATALSLLFAGCVQELAVYVLSHYQICQPDSITASGSHVMMPFHKCRQQECLFKSRNAFYLGILRLRIRQVRAMKPQNRLFLSQTSVLQVIHHNTASDYCYGSCINCRIIMTRRKNRASVSAQGWSNLIIVCPRMVLINH